MKHFLAIVLIALLALPGAIVIVILLVPFWGWLEATSGIESLGHSGPSDWCYATVYVILVSLGIGTWFFLRPRRS